MSIEAPQGILNIPNATLRVGRLEINEVVGADTALNTIARNTILLVEDTTYHENKNWALKLPNAWAGEFECNTASAGNFSEFNFYNEGASSNAQGYNLTFNDTAVELRYDGTLLTSGTLPSTIVGTGVKKVRLMFERTILSVTVDGTLVFTHDDTSGPRPRVYSTTAGGFLNFFTDGGALKNLKIVNEKWISDGTSNIAYVGGGEVAIGQSLNLQQVSNTSMIKMNSNVVTEFPRSKKLIRYPRVALTAASGESSGYQGYYVTESSNAANDPDRTSWKAFNMTFSNADSDDTWTTDEGTNYDGSNNTYNPSADNPVKNLGTGAVDGEWIKLQLPHKIRLEYMKIWLKDNDPQRIPEDWKLYGSDDNTNWTELFSKIGQGAILENTYNVNATSMYNYLAVVVTKISVQPDYFRIVELEFFGTPEYDPEAHGTDVTVKSVPNVPNTDWLEVYYDAKDLATMPNTVTDLSPNTNTGAVSGHSPTLDTTGGVNSFVFDGTDDYITSTLTGLSSSQYTMAGWIKVDTLDSTVNTFFSLGDWVSGNGRAIGIAIDSSNRIGANVKGVPDAIFSEVTTGEWYHVVADFTSGNDTHLYVNGKLVDTVAGTTFAIPTNPPLFIGSRANASGTVETARLFPGSIANFRLFNRVLTSDEIYQLYAYQKKYFGHGDLGMTLKAGRLGIGTSEPRAALDVRGLARFNNVFFYARALSTGTNYYEASFQNTGGRTSINDVQRSSGGLALSSDGCGVTVTSSDASGVYMVYCQIALKTEGTTSRSYFATLRKNGTQFATANQNIDHITSSTYNQHILSALIDLDAGDEVIHETSANSNFKVYSNATQFYMYRISS